MPSVGQTSSPHLRPRPRGGGGGGPGRAAHSQRRWGAAEPGAPLSFLSPISQSDKTHLIPQDGVNRKEERKGPWGKPVEFPPNTQDTLGTENKHLPSPAIIIPFFGEKAEARRIKGACQVSGEMQVTSVRQLCAVCSYTAQSCSTLGLKPGSK